MVNKIIRRFICSGLLASPLIMSIANPPRGYAQSNPQPEPQPQSNSILSMRGGEQLMKEASDAIGSEQYNVAINKLQQARKIFNQLSNFHLQLAESFSGIDSQIYESNRDNALKSGQLRDEATYQLALVHRAQNQPELAVPLLVQIIRSQDPTSELGKKSYQQLYELGFVESPYAPAAPSSASPSPPQEQEQEQDN
jgi:hypothetical protein